MKRKYWLELLLANLRFLSSSLGYEGDNYEKQSGLKAAGLFKYVWPFSGHQALKV